MKDALFVIGITCVKGAMAAVYAILKLFPVKRGKVVFLSRQSDRISLDFQRLKDELESRPERPQVVVICCTMDSLPRFAAATFRSLYHLATSSVCVLDTYWPAVSLLHHKKTLTVIQMWHSIGKIKQSGLVSVGRTGGRSALVAKTLKMHANNDYVIAGAAAFNPFYCDSFGIQEEQIVNLGLPRIDFLMEDNNERGRLEEAYPELKGKKLVLYAPTFRRGMETGLLTFCEAVGEFPGIHVIVKGHPLQQLEKTERVSEEQAAGEILDIGDDWSTLELLKACDYLITDYSAIAVEAACIKRKTYFWVYDYESYIKNNGLNVPIKEEVGGNASEDIREIFRRIADGDFNEEQFDAYVKKYTLSDLGHSAADIADLVIRQMDKEQ